MISTRKNGLVFALFLIFCTGAHADLPSGSFRDVKPVSGLENPWRDQAPTLVDDGLTIYFSSTRPTATNPGGEELDIWTATRVSTDAAFGEPTNLGLPVNLPDVRDGTTAFTDDLLTVYFASRRGSTNNTSDILVSTRSSLSDPWSDPTSIGSAVNTDDGEFSPWLTDNGLALYFTRRIGTDASTERIYKSTRSSSSDDFGAPELVDIQPATRNAHSTISSDGLAMFYHTVVDGDLKIWAASRDSTDMDFGSPISGMTLGIDGPDNVFTPFLDSSWPEKGAKLYFAGFSDVSDWDFYEATWIPEPSSGLLLVMAALTCLTCRRLRRN